MLVQLLRCTNPAQAEASKCWLQTSPTQRRALLGERLLPAAGACRSTGSCMHTASLLQLSATPPPSLFQQIWELGGRSLSPCLDRSDLSILDLRASRWAAHGRAWAKAWLKADESTHCRGKDSVGAITRQRAATGDDTQPELSVCIQGSAPNALIPFLIRRASSGDPPKQVGSSSTESITAALSLP